MRRWIFTVLFIITGWMGCLAQNVTLKVKDEAAAAVFRSIIEQTGKNFVYSSELLDGVAVTVDAKNKPLKKVLGEMFRNTGIEYKIRGNNVVLKRRYKPVSVRRDVPKVKQSNAIERKGEDIEGAEFKEVVVISRLETPQVESAEIGAKKITADEVRNTPVLLGESDVVKSLQMQPGVTEGTEGMAGMHVHGGNDDENLFMLENVPLYQVNHFAGLFSAFNTDIIRYLDFFKTSIPAKYDGRLSSFMDVRLKNGNIDGHHGSGRLGLTSGAFNISGPIGDRTTYLAGVRRSWYDVLSAPALAIVNSKNPDEKIRLRYYFMDFNARITHRLSHRANIYFNAYYGDDMLKSGSDDKSDGDWGWWEKDRYDFNWGNLLLQGGANYRINDAMTSEFTAAYTRYFSKMKHDERDKEWNYDDESETRIIVRTDNNINDWIFRGDFDWKPSEKSRVRFGGNYVRHSFLPVRTAREYSFNDSKVTTTDSISAYHANEFNAYIEDDMIISERFRANAGVHASLFNIDGKTHTGLSPRISLSFRPNENVAIKTAYSRTVQYVHQLTQSYLSLPTDQWIPITGKFKPQSADKIAAGMYWQSGKGMYAASVEGYYKFMHNLVDYRDEYYLSPPLEMWDARLTSGKGTAKGLDFKIEKTSGKVTGHIAYSLAWTDRQFKEKNGGMSFPARFDNRHTINVLINWNINDRVTVNAAWTGHSGNRFTLLPQMFESPGFGSEWDQAGEGIPLKSRINNYQLPFYHRLDLSCRVNNRHGYWTFGLYNAYCHMNTIAIRRSYKIVMETTPSGTNSTLKPVFQKVKLLPVIPSISYTWQF